MNRRYSPLTRRQVNLTPPTTAPGPNAPAFRLIAVLAALLALAALSPATAATPATAPKTPAAATSPADPQAMLHQAVDEVLDLAYPATKPAAPATPAPAPETLATRLRPVLEKYFSFDLVTRSAVGPGWSSFTAEQQKRTTQLFSELVIRSYADKFEPGERPKITYAKPTEPDATRRELPTTLTYAGKNYSVSYRMRQLPEGWRIYDVNIEGVSMVSNYRAQFDPLFQKGGAAAIIAALEKNIADFAAAKK